MCLSSGLAILEAGGDAGVAFALWEEGAGKGGRWGVGEAVAEGTGLAADEQAGGAVVADGEQFGQARRGGAWPVEEAGGFGQDVLGVEGVTRQCCQRGEATGDSGGHVAPQEAPAD